MIKIGQEVKVIYDPRPVYPRQEVKGVVVKITKTGLLRIKTGSEIWDSAYFYQGPGGMGGRARGWNTLRWEAMS